MYTIGNSNSTDQKLLSKFPSSAINAKLSSFKRSFDIVADITGSESFFGIDATLLLLYVCTSV